MSLVREFHHSNTKGHWDSPSSTTFSCPTFLLLVPLQLQAPFYFHVTCSSTLSFYLHTSHSSGFLPPSRVLHVIGYLFIFPLLLGHKFHWQYLWRWCTFSCLISVLTLFSVKINDQKSKTSIVLWSDFQRAMCWRFGSQSEVCGAIRRCKDLWEVRSSEKNVND